MSKDKALFAYVVVAIAVLTYLQGCAEAPHLAPIPGMQADHLCVTGQKDEAGLTRTGMWSG